MTEHRRGERAAEVRALEVVQLNVNQDAGVIVRCKADVKTMAPSALSAVVDNGLLWFAYPKKSGPLQSDLSRDSGWEPLFAAGFDSVAQISIDETWTGFRFRPKHLVGKRPR